MHGGDILVLRLPGDKSRIGNPGHGRKDQAGSGRLGDLGVRLLLRPNDHVQNSLRSAARVNHDLNIKSACLAIRGSQ